jgi:hypothetical protein
LVSRELDSRELDSRKGAKIAKLKSAVLFAPPLLSLREMALRKGAKIAKQKSTAFCTLYASFAVFA